MKKFGDDKTSQAMVLEEIDQWLMQKLAVQSTTAYDTAECMRVFASFGKTLGQALGYAEFMFKQKGTITLTTGHKAKGLEWPNVYHLDPWLIKQGEEQEDNLDYVITTRSKDKLFEIESKEII
jgi:superfamily I DNA/RNA helicase